MIRRWSCLNIFNLDFESNVDFFFQRKFNIMKLARTLNYKKSTFGLTRFRRHRLAKRKRHSNWVLYTQVIRYWIKDYDFNKQLVRSQFFNSIFLHSLYAYSCYYVKKKNPLNDLAITSCLVNSTPKLFHFYANHKYENKNPFSFLFASSNSNFLTAHFENLDFSFFQEENRISPLLLKIEDTLYSFFLLKTQTKNNFPFIFNLIFYSFIKSFYNIYKIFSFFFLIRR